MTSTVIRTDGLPACGPGPAPVVPIPAPVSQELRFVRMPRAAALADALLKLYPKLKAGANG